MHAAPAEAVAADADAVLQSRAVALHEVKPPLGGIHHDRARREVGRIVDGLARDRAPAAAIVTAALITAALVVAAATLVSTALIAVAIVRRPATAHELAHVHALGV